MNYMKNNMSGNFEFLNGFNLFFAAFDLITTLFQNIY